MLSNPKSTRILTWSVIKRWMSCRRNWYYRYVGQVQPPTGLALLEGDLMHQLFESHAIEQQKLQSSQISTGKGQYSLDELAESAKKIIENWKSIASTMVQRSNSFTEDVFFSLEDIEQSAKMIFWMFKNYLSYFHENDDRHEVISVETEFNDVLVPSSENAGWTKNWRLAGKVDALLRCRDTGDFIIREIKTTSSDVDAFHKRIELDPQIRLYAEGLYRSGVTNRPIDRVQYIVLRKAVEKLPKIVTCPSCKAGKKKVSDCTVCKGKGEAPSTDKRVDATRDTVLSFLASHGLAIKIGQGRHDSGWIYTNRRDWIVHALYAPLVDNLKGQEKFVRVHEIYLRDAEKKEVLAEARIVAREITRSTIDYSKDGDFQAHFPRNISQCTGPAGYCEFRKHCVTQTNAEKLHSLALSEGWLHVRDHPELQGQMLLQIQPQTDGLSMQKKPEPIQKEIIDEAFEREGSTG